MSETRDEQAFRAEVEAFRAEVRAALRASRIFSDTLLADYRAECWVRAAMAQAVVPPETSARDPLLPLPARRKDS